MACAVVIADRLSFAYVAQWREDQATNLWLGYRILEQYPPVGLISSQGASNPNGMPLLGALFSLLPNLVWISLSLSLLQCAAALVLASSLMSLFPAQRRHAFVFALLCLSSPLMRGTSTEFWNNWINTIPILFACAILLRSAQPSSSRILLFVILLAWILALYLTGPLTVFTLCVSLALIMLYQRRYDIAAWKAHLACLRSPRVIAGTCLVAFLAYVATWRTFLLHVPIGGLLGHSEHPSTLLVRFLAAGEALLTYPRSLIHYASMGVGTVLSDERILSAHAKAALMGVRIVLTVQSILVSAWFCLALLWYRSELRQALKNSGVYLVLVSSGIPLLVNVVSPLIGGPWYHRGMRPDQSVQFFPCVLLSLFILPELLLIHVSWLSSLVRRTTLVAIACIVPLGAYAGNAAVRSHLSYRGQVSSTADVPLIDKRSVTDFIAADWLARHNGSTIPVDYALAGLWGWVPSSGERYRKIYPSPMTIGRSFDFELRRAYGLTNIQEGVQHRTVGFGNYIVSYAHEPAPRFQVRGAVEERLFGRLRVSTRR